MRQTVSKILLLSLLLLCGCHDTIMVYPPPRIPKPPPPIPDVSENPPPAPEPPPKLSAGEIAEMRMLEIADTNFILGKYKEAIEVYQAYLERYPQSKSRDKALFRLGLSQALSSGSGKGLSGAKTSLKRMLSEFPASVYKSQAELILGLIAQVDTLNVEVEEGNSKIQRLQEELKRLKEIDLQRSPSRPSDQ
jgi:tetratricopeptide (TPR) repeat protein